MSEIIWKTRSMSASVQCSTVKAILAAIGDDVVFCSGELERNLV